MNHNKHSTPLLDAARRQPAIYACDCTDFHHCHACKSRGVAHHNDDAATGYDPYRGRASRTIPVPGEFPQTAKHEATQILACYETQLSIQE